MKNKKKICIVVASRANYSSIKSVLKNIIDSDKLELQLILCASALNDKFGNIGDLIKNDRIKVNQKLDFLHTGNTPESMVKTTSLGMIELSNAFKNLKPDLVLTVGDRYETMATVIAAAYMNIPIAHTMGGEISGSIDESIRHAITKFSHIHFPATLKSYKRIIKLGEKKSSVFLTGCPRIDLIDEVNIHSFNKNLFKSGVGEEIDIDKKFLLVSFHAVTTEFGLAEIQMNKILSVIKSFDLQSIVLWPNADAGTDDIAKSIRKFREKGLDKKMHFFKNIPVNDYIFLMKKTSCLVGNSSSGIREGSFIGTPVVNIGSRQNDREKGGNVITVELEENLIKKSISKQINRGFYKRSTLYGSGDAGIKITKILEDLEKISVQKRLTY
jgi:UDP-hydrolysing UDP-N-acetyl-D-glucosamine 2-epimerase|tara:strand:- start:1817 stop:2971 length:1155 start_codon:yes stop_codon:yes gene_type:complete